MRYTDMTEEQRAKITAFRAFVEGLAIERGWQVVDIVTGEEQTEWILSRKGQPGYWYLRLDNDLALAPNRVPAKDAAITELERLALL